MIKLSRLIRLHEEDMPQTESIQEDDFDKLVKVLGNEKLQVDYSKILTIFNGFDPNSVGTISEILLTKIINKYAPSGIKALHTGASGGLSDLKLVVDGKEIGISLKTTGDNAINLGSADATIGRPPDVQDLQMYANRTISDIELDMKAATGSEKSDLKDLYESCMGRVKAIAEKLAGAQDDEIFLWVYKQRTKNTPLITGIIFNVVKFKSASIEKFLSSECVIQIPKGGGSWGLGISDQNVITAQKFGVGKYLNINPRIINNPNIMSAMGAKARTIPISLIDTSVFKDDIDFAQRVSGLSDKVLNSFIQLYDDIVKK